MHGAAQTANAAPSRIAEPVRRAPSSSPGAAIRVGIGSSPMNARPSTTSTKPAIASRVSASTKPPTAAAPAPISTKTTEKPAMNGTLEIATRRAMPRSPRRPASTAETADRYPGSSGRTQGVRTEMKPARNATGTLPAIALGRVEARQLAVDEPVELGIELLRLGTGLPRARPAPGEPADDRHGHRQPDQRQQPRQQVESAPGRRREHGLAELRGERVLDLGLRLPRCDLAGDEHLDVLRDGRVRLVDRRAAHGAHDLALELVLRGVPLARKRGRGRRERNRDGAEQCPHAGLSALSSMRAMSADSSSPIW